jgi:hypothetical protein
MTDVYLQGGPNNGLSAPLAVEDDKQHLWFVNTATNARDRYRRTTGTMEIEGVLHVVFEYDPA